MGILAPLSLFCSASLCRYRARIRVASYSFRITKQASLDLISTSATRCSKNLRRVYVLVGFNQARKKQNPKNQTKTKPKSKSKSKTL